MEIKSSCIIGIEKPYSVEISELSKSEHTAVLTLAKKLKSGDIQIDDILKIISDAAEKFAGDKSDLRELSIGLSALGLGSHKPLVAGTQMVDFSTRHLVDHIATLHDDAEDSNPNMNAAILLKDEFSKIHPSVKQITKTCLSTPPMYGGVPTVKHRLFEYVKSIGGVIRYTDAIKFLLKEIRGIEIPKDKGLGKERGFYAGGFTRQAYFTRPGKDGRYLYKRKDGLYELQNPNNITY